MELGVYSTVSMLCSSLGGSTALAMLHRQNSFHYFTIPQAFDTNSLPFINKKYLEFDNTTTMIQRS